MPNGTPIVFRGRLASHRSNGWSARHEHRLEVECWEETFRVTIRTSVHHTNSAEFPRAEWTRVSRYLAHKYMMNLPEEYPTSDADPLALMLPEGSLVVEEDFPRLRASKRSEERPPVRRSVRVIED